jgi:murein DD-endopeptidase MepM/ murein hydrolase activator NlpD
MGATKFTYNPENCRYEPFYVKGKLLTKRIALFLTLSFVIASAGYYFSIQYFQSWDEMMLQQKNDQLKISWDILRERLQNARHDLAVLIEKDDHNYRVILDSSPLPASIREAGIGGSEKLDLRSLAEYPYIIKERLSADKLKHQADVEVQSYEELEKILNAKLVAWASRPAIQPINNTQLDQLHLTFGSRLHPIFKVFQDHKGLDFAAAEHTPVYATGDGKIQMAYYSDSYGKVIFIDHGFSFESRYAHLSAFAVSAGETVKRGQLIGYVGNTGNSVAPHLHYEILFQGQQVNPINFFQRDLSNEEYQKLIELGSENSTSLD